MLIIASLKKIKKPLDYFAICAILYSHMKPIEKLENLFASHINRIQKDIAERNGRYSHLTEVDLKNIASLREGRVPEYGDHIPGNTAGAMWEFDDIVEAQAAQ